MEEERLDNSNGMFEESYATEKPERPMATIERLWASSQDQHMRLVVVLFCVLCYTVLSVAAPYYSAGIVDVLWYHIQETRTLEKAFVITWQQGGFEILILFLLYLGSWAFYSLQAYLMVSFAENLNLKLRTEMSQKLNCLPLSYFDGHKTGGILSHFTNDLDKMSEAIQRGVLQFFTSVGLIFGSIIMMFRFNVTMTLIFIGFLILSMLVTKLFSRATLQYALQRQQAMGKVTSFVEESYSGRSIIKAFHQEQKSIQKIHAANQELADAAEKADFFINAINPAIRMVNRFGQMCIAVYAGWLLLQGRLTPGVFQAYFQYVNQSMEPVTEASYVINSMQSALASAERIYKLLDEVELSPESEQPVVIERAKGLVEFRKVSFGYTPVQELMKEINFTAKPGQKVAIVGATGAGKTTLINLLMRFYEVNDGHILLDGVDISAMTRKSLRSHFGMVLQDTWLFEGTIAENIAYGKPNATREEIIAAAKAARVDFFVRTMPQGYDTILTNDAESISVGQRQLLTIARVFLCNPAVLILDEATSSVDTRTEIEIGKAMKALMQNRTSFVIAHRLSTIVDADFILVMEHGTIIEQGNHATLLEQKGAYAELYHSQFAPSVTVK